MRCFSVRGRLLLALVLLVPWSPADADVVITELMYHPPSDLAGDEFIELLNTGAADVDLQDWCFEGVELCFPPGATILAGGRLVLAHDAVQFQTAYGFAPDHIYLNKLDNSGERIALRDATLTVVDEVEYVDLPPWPITPDGLGPSLEVVDPAEDNSVPRNWRASTDADRHTAGSVNSVENTGLPPWIEEISHTVDPLPSAPVVVTARVLDATTVELYYLIDFGTEVLLDMLDDGLSGDGAAGDGIYGATIPGQPEGTLIRYRITAAGTTGFAAYPREDDTVTYDGTAVQDPALSSALPVYWWFMDPVDYADSIAHRYTNQLEPAVLYYNGTLFDGIQVRVRGQSARGYVKKHWKFHMPHGHPFYDPDLVPIPFDQFNLQGNYSDKTFVRERLSYSTFLESGTPAGITHSVRLQQNGTFYGLYTFLQAMDDDYLSTNQLDPNGAWYKAFSSCEYGSLGDLPGKYEKKTRLHEGYEDLHALLDGANNLSGQARRDFLFDNVDIAKMVNYLATTVVIHNTDFPHKNYFIYRDTENNGRWTMHPWDMDLTFGRNWQGTVLNDEIWADRDSIPGKSASVSPSHPLVGESEHKNWDNRWNRLIDALYEEAEFRQMYHRRLRTLVDWLLADGRYEAIIDEATAPLAPEATLDAATWGQYGQPQTLAEAVAILETEYLLVRRTHLLVTHQGPGEIPEAQSSNPPIVITEIMYDPLAGSEHEFVELYNPSTTEAVDLSGYRLDGLSLSLPAGAVILPDSYMLVARDDPAFRAEYGSGNFVAAQYTGTLDGDGETIRLRDRDGNTVARVDYTDDPPWPVAADGGGPSLELIDLTEENGWVANWAPSAAPGGTPGAPNSVAGSIAPHPGIYINEVLPLNASINPDEDGDYHSWIELYNANTGPVELGGMTLTNQHSQPDLWEIPLGTQLCGGCFLIVWADAEPAEGPLHATFQMSPFGGTIGLYDSSGGIVDYLDYGILASDTSFGRFPDGLPDRRVFTAVTPADFNLATFIPLILNEYNAVNPGELLENDGSDPFWGRIAGNGGDWIELVVTQDRLDLRGWELLLTNETGGPGETQQLLTLSNDALWSDLRGGTLITISEDLPDDVSFDPASGDWWINVQAADTASGTYITAQDFAVTNDDWQLTILDDTGLPVFGPAGEGIFPVAGVGGDEVFKLEQDPGPFITPYSIYNDGSSSTFGAPNRFAAGTLEQDFSLLRCDGQACTSLDGPCGLGVCDPGSGQCRLQVRNEGLACDDGDPCSTADRCSGGTCLTGVPLCEDGSLCTWNSCEAGECFRVVNGICQLTGSVRYYRDFETETEPSVKPVAGVSIDLDDDALVDGVTDVDGAYLVPDQAGTLTVAPLANYGDDGSSANAQGAVSPFDATFIAEYKVGLLELSANQLLVADGSGDGTISSLDAALVAQLSVGLRQHLPVANTVGSDWLYLRCDRYLAEDDQDCTDPLYVHDPLMVTETDDFYALLYGDVTGNWAPPETPPASAAERAEAAAARYDRQRLVGLTGRAGGSLRGVAEDYELPPGTTVRGRSTLVEGEDGGRLNRIVVSVQEGERIQALDLTLTYDPNAVEVLSLETAELTQGFRLVTHDSEGLFRGAVWNPFPLGRSGDVLVLTVRERPTAVGTESLRLEIVANEKAFVVKIDHAA